MKIRLAASNHDNPHRVTINTPAWMDRSACASLGEASKTSNRALRELELAFPPTKADARLFIRKYCQNCPVKQECGDYAERLNIPYGIYGGVVRGKDYLQETA